MKRSLGKPGLLFFREIRNRTLRGVLQTAPARDQRLLSGAAPYFDELKRLNENIFPILLVFDIFLF